MSSGPDQNSLGASPCSPRFCPQSMGVEPGAPSCPSRDQKRPSPRWCPAQWRITYTRQPAFCVSAHVYRNLCAKLYPRPQACLHIHVHMCLGDLTVVTEVDCPEVIRYQWGGTGETVGPGKGLPSPHHHDHRDKSQSHHLIKPHHCPPQGQGTATVPSVAQEKGPAREPQLVRQDSGHPSCSTDPTAPRGGSPWKGGRWSPWLPRGCLAPPRPAGMGRCSRGHPGTGLVGGGDADGRGDQRSPAPGRAELGAWMEPQECRGGGWIPYKCARLLLEGHSRAPQGGCLVQSPVWEPRAV